MALRRHGLALWMAWAAAGAVGTAVTATSQMPGYDFVFTEPGGWHAVIAAFVALPVTLLQFIVLRAALGASKRAAAGWVVVSLAAAAAAGYVVIAWGTVVFPWLAGSVAANQIDLQTVILRAGDYIYSVILGLAQGIVLSMMFGRKLLMVVWFAANTIASYMSLHVVQLLTSSWSIQTFTTPAGWVLPRVALAALYAAITGAALVAMTTPARTATAPAPAAR